MLMTDVPTWKKILPIVLPSMVEAENFSDHYHTAIPYVFEIPLYNSKLQIKSNIQEFKYYIDREITCLSQPQENLENTLQNLQKHL
jgi:hypothetical protein